MYALVVKWINVLIPQAFVNKMIDNKLGQDDKDKQFSLKCQAFIWPINNTEITVGLLVGVAVCN